MLLIPKIVAFFVFLLISLLQVKAQKIVIDTASTNKYIIRKPVAETQASAEEATPEEVSFGERALSIGNGILNRLKARLNLEEAAESIKQKGERLVKSKPEKNDSKQVQKDGG